MNYSITVLDTKLISLLSLWSSLMIIGFCFELFCKAFNISAFETSNKKFDVSFCFLILFNHIFYGTLKVFQIMLGIILFTISEDEHHSLHLGIGFQFVILVHHIFAAFYNCIIQPGRRLICFIRNVNTFSILERTHFDSGTKESHCSLNAIYFYTSIYRSLHILQSLPNCFFKSHCHA